MAQLRKTICTVGFELGGDPHLFEAGVDAQLEEVHLVDPVVVELLLIVVLHLLLRKLSQRLQPLGAVYDSCKTAVCRTRNFLLKHVDCPYGEVGEHCILWQKRFLAGYALQEVLPVLDYPQLGSAKSQYAILVPGAIRSNLFDDVRVLLGDGLRVDEPEVEGRLEQVRYVHVPIVGVLQGLRVIKSFYEGLSQLIVHDCVLGDGVEYALGSDRFLVPVGVGPSHLHHQLVKLPRHYRR